MKKFILSLLLSTTAFASGFFGAGGSGSSPAIGGPVLSGTANSVLFVNPISILDEDPTLFGYQKSTGRFCLGCDVATATDTFHLVGTGRFASLSTGLGHLSSTGVLSSSLLVNADVSSSAAITRSKLANGTANRLVVNDGSGVISEVASSGSSTTLLHGAAAGAPTFSAVSLTADVSGNLPVTNLNSGTSAGATTFWRGDSTWSTAVTSVAATVPGILTISGSPITTSGTLAIGATGTSGGIPYFSSTTTLATSGLLTQSAIVLGGGAAASPTVLGSLGTTSTVLHGNAVGAPSYAAVALTTDVSGALPLLNGGTGTAAASANAAFNALSPMTTGGDVIYGGASGVATRLANGSSGQYIKSTGGTSAPAWSSFTAPTIQKFTSSSGTYTTPTSPAPVYIRVRMVGGGGGGTGSGSTAGAGTSGGNTTFGTTLLVANGGVNGGFGNNGGAGGSASLGSGPIGIAVAGSAGCPGANGAGVAGGSGGTSALGGSGAGGFVTLAGTVASTNSGSGGGGGGGNDPGIVAGSGGGSGGFVDAIITSPSATYSYAVGAAGSGGGAGTSGAAGGAGAAGIVEVTEFYQ